MSEKNSSQKHSNIFQLFAVLLYCVFHCIKCYFLSFFAFACVFAVFIMVYPMLFSSFTFTDSIVAHVSSVIIAICISAFVFRMCYKKIKRIYNDEESFFILNFYVKPLEWLQHNLPIR